MKVAESSQKLLQEYFCGEGICASPNIPDFKIYSRRGASLITRLLSVNGITLGKRILINSKFVSRGSDQRLVGSRRLITHEFVHVLQYQRDGVFPFLAKYMRDFFRNLKMQEKWNSQSWQKAYLEIPYEIEARAETLKFENWYLTRSKSK